MKTIPYIYLPAIAFIFVFTACTDSPGKDYRTIDGFGLGTSYHIIIESPDTAGIRYSIDSLFNELENSLSVYRKNSLINRLNRNETDTVDVHIARCIERASIVSRLTGGVYDITIKPLTDAWGFTEKQRQVNPNIDSLLQYVGYRKIKIVNGRLVKERPEIHIELNSIAKGYIVDAAAEFVGSCGVTNYMVEIGGEIRCKGVNSKSMPWQIAIDRPVEGNYIAGSDTQITLSVTDKALATSGNYRRFYIDETGRKVVHTVNALTGSSSPGNVLSATVITNECAISDALATAMMAVGLDRSVEILEANPGWSAYLIYSNEDGSYGEYYSPALLGN